MEYLYVIIAILVSIWVGIALHQQSRFPKDHFMYRGARNADIVLSIIVGALWPVFVITSLMCLFGILVKRWFFGDWR